jgi:hypothetical protein
MPSCCLVLSYTSLPHDIWTQGCTTLHRTNVPGQVKVKRRPCYFHRIFRVWVSFITLCRFSNIPCTPTTSHGIAHYCTAPVCAIDRRRPPSDSKRRRWRWRTAASQTVVSELVAAGSTSTVDHGAFPAGSSQRRATASRVPTTISHRPNAQ